MAREAVGEGTEVTLDAGTGLAYERTFLAHERTQMAWVRTALALISFGFTIAKFFELLHVKDGVPGPRLQPRTVGILMIAIGLVALLVSTWQHERALQVLRAACPNLPKSVSWVTAMLIALLGLLALAGAIFRI